MDYLYRVLFTVSEGFQFYYLLQFSCNNHFKFITAKLMQLQRLCDVGRYWKKIEFIPSFTIIMTSIQTCYLITIKFLV